MNEIQINGLRLLCRVGVPDEELAQPQELRMHLTLCPTTDWQYVDDRIENTIDYAAVVAEIESLAADHPRRLIETLAQDAANFLLERYPLKSAKIVIEKFILPQTNFVAVVVELHR
jgi:dihydroneopterin aldolase